MHLECLQLMFPVCSFLSDVFRDDDGRSPSRSGAGVLGSTKIGALMNKLREQQDHG